MELQKLILSGGCQNRIFCEGVRKMKLTVVFTGCSQVGQNTFADYHKTRTISFTEEQKQLLSPPDGMHISNTVFELEDGDEW